MTIFTAFTMPFSKPPEEFEFAKARSLMLERQIIARGVKDPRVLEAMGKVPREKFVPDESKSIAYSDSPLRIGFGQTISQPYIVALMTELAHVTFEDSVLEIGTGSGYQTAILAELANSVYSMEIIPELQQNADSTIRALGYDNVTTRCADGYFGWPEAGPFDSIIVTAAPEKLPDELLSQLKDGGRMVVPVGGDIQYLEVYAKTGNGYEKKRGIPVKFVPMTGKVQEG